MLKQIHWNKWGFIPSLLLLAASIVILLLMADAPRWPLHFTADGTPNRYGSSRELWSLVTLQIFLILAMACLDEGMTMLRKWQFHIAGAIAGFLSGVFGAAIFYSYHVGHTNHKEPYILFGVLGFGVLAALCSWLLESIRRYPQETHPSVRVSSLPDLTSKNWFYWEHVNPAWLNWMLLFVLIGIASISLTTPNFSILPIILIGAVTIPLIGGIYFTLTPQQLNIRFGWLKIPVLKLKTANIKTVETLEINPLRDFGGWGIRYGIKTGWGFILGSSCVRLETLSGRKITISLTNPDQVVRIIRQQTPQ